jgi:hypothetical protein
MYMSVDNRANGSRPRSGAIALPIPTMVARSRRIRPVRGVGGFFFPAADIPGALPLTDASYGLPPGYPCYDTTHDNGMIHGGATTDAWMLSNVTTALSNAESECLAGRLVRINPPTPPVVDPETGLLTPGTQTNTPIACADGSLDCQPANPSACAWYCGIPLANQISPTFATDCAGCPSSNLSTFLIVAAAVVGGLMLANVSRI